MCIIFTVILLLMFSFAVVGMELFAGTVTQALTCSDTAVASSGSRLLVASVDGDALLLPRSVGAQESSPDREEYVSDVGWQPPEPRGRKDKSEREAATGGWSSRSGEATARDYTAAWVGGATRQHGTPNRSSRGPLSRGSRGVRHDGARGGDSGTPSASAGGKEPRGGGRAASSSAVALQQEINSVRRLLAELEAEMGQFGAAEPATPAEPLARHGAGLRGRHAGVLPDGHAPAAPLPRAAAGTVLPRPRTRAATRVRRRRLAVSGGADDSNTTNIPCSDLPGFVDTNMSFDTFLDAMLVLFQMVTTSNWHEVMYTAMWATGEWVFGRAKLRSRE